MAEVNHSSVVAHLGPGGLMTIVEHLSNLLERHQHLYNKERESEIRATVTRMSFQSKLVGDASIEDTKAKKALSLYAYSELFQSEFKNSEFF